jgi:hypothetical protein
MSVLRKLLICAVGLLGLSAATPALAQDNYLFGFSPYGVQTLTLNGSIVLTATDTGWISAVGVHGAANQNYFVGDCSCSAAPSANNYFVFNLGNVTAPITSAVLSVGNGNGYVAGPLSTYSLFDVNNPISSLDLDRASGNAGGIALYNDLQSGVLFGSRGITSVVQNSQVDTILNGSAITALNAARGSQFAIGGTLRPGDIVPGGVPEPATWAMMLMGFGAIGGALRRREKVAARVRFA